MDIYPPAVQRPALLTLATALSSAATMLRRDECGDWRINGTAGHIYAVPEGFQLIVETRTGRAWGAAKRRLAFASIQRDGDKEGAFILDRLPDTTEAAEIRMVLGIRKRPAITEDHLDALRQRFAAPSMAPSHADIAVELPVAA